MIMSTLHCNFLWAVRKEKQSDKSLRKISLQDIHHLTDESFYNIPIKESSKFKLTTTTKITQELYLSTTKQEAAEKLSSSQCREFQCSNFLVSSGMEHK